MSRKRRATTIGTGALLLASSAISAILAISAMLAISPVASAQRPAGTGEVVENAAPASPVFTENTVVIEGADRRPQTSLDGDWRTIVDPYFSGLYNFHHEELKNGWFLNEHWGGMGDNHLLQYDFAKSPTLRVPGDWNTQRPELFFYEGPLWYQRDFTFAAEAGKRVFLHVGAANYRSIFWVNGQKVCQHEGGFTTFDCEVTAQLKNGANFIVAAINNQRLPDGVPTLETDWWNYGGFTRSVSLLEVPQTFVSGYDLHLDRGTRSRIEGWVQLTGAKAATQAIVELPALHARATVELDAKGYGVLSLPVKGLQPWSPESPKLYKVEISTGNDTLAEEMGFKTIETRGTQILLNGKPIFLRGICIHAEAPVRTGRASTAKDIDTLIGWAKELGANYVRLAHYPHDEKMTRAADRAGLLVWSEIPTYWAVQFGNPTVLAKAKQQLREEIARDRNRVSIALWSVANETPNTPTRTAFLTSLAEEARSLDGQRLVTAALLVRDGGPQEKVVDDPLGKALDVLGINEYIGWYEGTPETADRTRWTVAYQKPVIVSELGGDAKAGLHGDASQRWTEEYEASLYKHNLPMLAKIPQMRGLSPWILMDFRSPMRQLPGVQDYFNRKGLISEQGQKKAAFGVLQEAYRNGYGKAE